MNKVKCMYCGEVIADDVETCPHCGSPSHFQKAGESKLKQVKFITWFIILVIVVFFFMFYLPR